MNRTVLYVTGFSPNLRARDLAYEFERYGRLVRCDIPALKSAHATPFAFVEFRREDDAEDGYYDMHGRSIDGRRLTVQWAKRPPSNAWRHDDFRRGDRRDDRDRDRRRSPPPRRRSPSPRRDRDYHDSRDRDRDYERRGGRDDREREGSGSERGRERGDREREREYESRESRERSRSRSPRERERGRSTSLPRNGEVERAVEPEPERED